MPKPVHLYDAASDHDVLEAADRAKAAVAAYNAAAAPQAVEATRAIIPPSLRLIGLDPGVYRQIAAAMNSGKRHLMFYGPPGTGKTELARYVAETVSPTTGFTLLTGSADWSSQDLIGGYQPTGGGEIVFVPGVLLKNFDKPLIIDELNRCDIDKVLGPLFTVLSGASTTLPYRVNVGDAESEQYSILGEYDPEVAPPTYSPQPSWRIIATMNTIDKASLYQMSYALSRRFAWIFVDVPTDLDAFVGEYLERGGANVTRPAEGFVLANIWQSVVDRRPLGPAPFIDFIAHCLALDEDFDFSVIPTSEASLDAYLDAFRVHVMPMLDGLLKGDLQSIASAVCAALAIADSDERAKTLTRQIEALGL